MSHSICHPRLESTLMIDRSGRTLPTAFCGAWAYIYMFLSAALPLEPTQGMQVVGGRIVSQMGVSNGCQLWVDLHLDILNSRTSDCSCMKTC